jgi:ribosomal protein S18 acetylase RimI-like enzyme
MKITKSTPADIPALAWMNKRLIEDEGHSNPMNVDELSQRMRQWLRNQYTCYIMKIDGEAVAYCLFRDDGDFYYMRHLYVERQHRRKGLGTYLLNWMYQNVWIGKKVRLEVLVHNQGAIDFYKQYGFQVDCLWMSK